MIKEFRPSGGTTPPNADLAKRIKAEAKRQERRTPHPAPAPADADGGRFDICRSCEIPKPAPRAALTRARSVLNWGAR